MTDQDARDAEFLALLEQAEEQAAAAYATATAELKGNVATDALATTWKMLRDWRRSETARQRKEARLAKQDAGERLHSAAVLVQAKEPGLGYEAALEKAKAQRPDLWRAYCESN